MNPQLLSNDDGVSAFSFLNLTSLTANPKIFGTSFLGRNPRFFVFIFNCKSPNGVFGRTKLKARLIGVSHAK